MVSKKNYGKKKYTKKRNTKKRFKNKKNTKRRIKKYKGGKAPLPKLFESVVLSEQLDVPINIGEEVPIINPPVNLDDAMIEEDSDDENNIDYENENVFDDLYTDLHPQELGLKGGSKRKYSKKNK
jgi:hypothetical protein